MLVTLAALARVHPVPVPAGAMDEARELATYGDQFAALAAPTPDDLALITDTARTTYRSVVPHRDWPANTRVSLAGDLAQVLESTLAAWAVDGSVVLARNGQHAGGEPQPERLAAEGVTIETAGVPATAGSGTKRWIQFSIATQVAPLTTPVGASLARDWTALTAAWVIGPKAPSGATRSARCRATTATPLEPCSG